ncbi:MAG: polysaccharide biosynthesis/export family protein [Candidatus Omnitrophica bacterium]|nr:polysaccharide biosynthesis/export family protein [Candidatus Omnitrophota bacterium]
MKIYDKRFFIAILISILVSSCATAKREKQISSDLRKAALKLSQKNSLSGTNYYTVDQDDVLDITVWKSLSTKKGEAEEYFLNDGDKLEISVWQWPDLLKDVVVRPDGKISFPLIGDVVAQGRTLTDLDNEITEKLSAFIKSPEVSIMITAFGTAQEGFLRPEINFVKVNELSTEQTVAPDGNIYLPLFGAVQAGGLTLNQLSLKIKERPSSLYRIRKYRLASDSSEEESLLSWARFSTREHMSLPERQQYWRLSAGPEVIPETPF